VEKRPDMAKISKDTFRHSGRQDSASRQLQVLLVEDNIINQKVLSKQLKKAGCNVEVANHGLEALESLEKKAFDIVLMDVEMPVLSGLDAMRRIRAKEVEQANASQAGEWKRLPIIAVTANVRKEQMDTAINAGAVSTVFLLLIYL
jgi:CheY-like chemotaxis protein